MEKGYFAGLTVQIEKLSEKDVYEIIKDFGVEKFVLNSDTGFDRADMFSTVKTVNYLEEKRCEKEDIRKLVFKNALRIFKIG